MPFKISNTQGLGPFCQIDASKTDHTSANLRALPHRTVQVSGISGSPRHIGVLGNADLLSEVSSRGLSALGYSARHPISSSVAAPPSRPATSHHPFLMTLCVRHAGTDDEPVASERLRYQTFQILSSSEPLMDPGAALEPPGAVSILGLTRAACAGARAGPLTRPSLRTDQLNPPKLWGFELGRSSCSRGGDVPRTHFSTRDSESCGCSLLGRDARTPLNLRGCSGRKRKLEQSKQRKDKRRHLAAGTVGRGDRAHWNPSQLKLLC